MLSKDSSMVLEVDLNEPLHDENMALDNRSNDANSCLDHDVMICSPRGFAEARSSRRRNASSNRGIITVDEHVDVHLSDEQATASTLGNNIGCGNKRFDGRNKRKRKTNKYMDLDQGDYGVEPSKEPIFTCPICMGQLVEEVSTICGHIFCRECIRTAIAAQKKCPTCRRRLNPRNVHRIYLPPIG